MKFFVLILLLLQVNLFALKVQCETQTTGEHNATICLKDYGNFKHWIFSLEVDNQLIFELVDDFAENINLLHKIPKGLVLELPLSKNSKDEVSIVGGCKPISENETEIARVCNFQWGNKKIIENIKFIHEEREKLPPTVDINKRMPHGQEFNTMLKCFNGKTVKYKFDGKYGKLYSKMINECTCEIKNIQQFYGFDKVHEIMKKDRLDPEFQRYKNFYNKTIESCKLP
jgi:hypothetical protein